MWRLRRRIPSAPQRVGRCRSSLQGNERAAEDCLISDGFGKNGPEGMNGWVETHPYQPGPYFVAFAARLRAYPQIVAPVSRPAVLAASKLPGAGGAGLETCTTAALESGATKTHGCAISRLLERWNSGNPAIRPRRSTYIGDSNPRSESPDPGDSCKIVFS